MVNHARFRRLLLWYPKAWRERNGVVLLDTMIEDTQRQGRTVPTASEEFSAIVHGLGTRLDARVALWCALCALAFAALAGGVSIWWMEPLTDSGVSWLIPVVTVALCPGLIAVGVVAFARQRGLVFEPRALVTVAFAGCAFALAAVTQASFSLGFDASDRGVAIVGFAAWWPWLFSAAWLVGGAAIAVFLDALLRQTRLNRFLRGGVAAGVAVALAPLIGVSVITPTSSAIGSAGLALLVLAFAPRRVSHSASPIDRGTIRSEAAVAGTRGLVIALSVTAAAGSTGGIVFALTGSQWPPGGPDATAVMGQGISIALAAAVPFLAAIGVVVTARTRYRPLLTWGPLLLVGCSLAAVAGAYLNAPEWEGVALGLAAASLLGGSAIAWWITPRLRGPARVRFAAGVLIGVAYAALLGMFVAPALAFAVPLLAAAFAIWGPRLWLASRRSGVARAQLVAEPS